MPDNWTFVAIAYALAAVVFGGYWRWLGRRERELWALRAGRPSRAAAGTLHARPEAAGRSPRP